VYYVNKLSNRAKPGNLLRKIRRMGGGEEIPVSCVSILYCVFVLQPSTFKPVTQLALLPVNCRL
jgi:hypothetical protein